MANLLVSSGWRTAGSVILAILILIVMIVIHEFGHYLAGKIFRFQINEFSVGFGPALFKHRSKRTGELFALRLIPLGGYCAFAGEDGLDEEESVKAKQPSDAEKADTQGEVPEAAPSQPPAQGGGEAAEPVDKSGWFTNRPCWQRIIVLVAGALMNYLLALFLIILCFMIYGQSVVKIAGVLPDEPAEYAAYSFKEGDLLLEAEGKRLFLTTDIAQALSGRKADDLVEFTVSREENGMRRIEQVKIRLRADVTVKNSTEISVVFKALGVGIEEREDGNRYYMLENANYRFGFFEGLGRSFVYSFKLAGSIFRVLGELLTGRLGLSAFGGPVTTISMTSQIVRQGFQSVLTIAGYIGVNLAVFNLLPIPALDGSKVVFTLIEWVRGKPVNRKVEAIIHAVGFVLLLGFAVLVDILQFV